MASFLLEPVQRLARYPMLIRQILHYTPKTYAEHDLVAKSLNLTEDLLRETNEAVRSAENREKLRDLQTRLNSVGNKSKFLSSLFTRKNSGIENVPP